MRNVMAGITIAATLAALFAVPVSAQTSAASFSKVIVIGDIGPTAPAAPWYTPLQRRQQNEKSLAVPGGPPRAFPISTPALSLGAIEDDEKQLHQRLPPQFRAMLAKPMFVIGSDPQSLAWLQQRADWLRRRSAMGIVIEVSNGTAWKKVIDTTRPLGLTVLPMPGDVLVKHGLRHYPIALTRDGVLQ